MKTQIKNNFKRKSQADSLVSIINILNYNDDSSSIQKLLKKLPKKLVSQIKKIQKTEKNEEKDYKLIGQKESEKRKKRKRTGKKDLLESTKKKKRRINVKLFENLSADVISLIFDILEYVEKFRVFIAMTFNEKLKMKMRPLIDMAFDSLKRLKTIKKKEDYAALYMETKKTGFHVNTFIKKMKVKNRTPIGFIELIDIFVPMNETKRSNIWYLGLAMIQRFIPTYYNSPGVNLKISKKVSVSRNLKYMPRVNREINKWYQDILNYNFTEITIDVMGLLKPFKINDLIYLCYSSISEGLIKFDKIEDIPVGLERLVYVRTTGFNMKLLKKGILIDSNDYYKFIDKKEKPKNISKNWNDKLSCVSGVYNSNGVNKDNSFTLSNEKNMVFFCMEVEIKIKNCSNIIIYVNEETSNLTIENSINCYIGAFGIVHSGFGLPIETIINNSKNIYVLGPNILFSRAFISNSNNCYLSCEFKKIDIENCDSILLDSYDIYKLKVIRSKNIKVKIDKTVPYINIFADRIFNLFYKSIRSETVQFYSNGISSTKNIINRTTLEDLYKYGVTWEDVNKYGFGEVSDKYVFKDSTKLKNSDFDFEKKRLNNKLHDQNELFIKSIE